MKQSSDLKQAISPEGTYIIPKRLVKDMKKVASQKAKNKGPDQ
jgi:hypothetical protein